MMYLKSKIYKKSQNNTLTKFNFFFNYSIRLYFNLQKKLKYEKKNLIKKINYVRNNSYQYCID